MDLILDYITLNWCNLVGSLGQIFKDYAHNVIGDFMSNLKNANITLQTILNAIHK